MNHPAASSRMISEKDLRQLYSDFRDAFVGPIPPREFLEELMPTDDLPEPGKLDLSKVARAAGSYAETCVALNKTLGCLCPHYEFKVTHKDINPDVGRGLRPHGACYPKRAHPRMASDEWRSVEFFFVISRTGEDPWSDGNPNDTANAYDESFWMQRARMIAYAKSMFSHQFRTAILSVAFYGITARLFRWDRTGVIVTQAFDYTQEPALLAEFMQRYERLDVAARGWDTTAQSASLEEERLYTDSIRAYLADVRARKVPMIPRMIDSLDWRYPVHKVRLDQSHCGQDGEVLVCRPVYELVSPLGRATQGRVAYHLGEKRLVFLKDIWATVEDNKLKEVDAYRYLAQREMAHMPKTLYAGYVKCPEGGVRRTRTQDYCSAVHSWVRKEWKLKERVHMRIAQDVVYPLRYVLNSQQLVQAVRDALIASRGANEKLGLMHCDVSTGNIMLTADGKGILNDWDHARFTGSDDCSPVGTLIYLSAAAAEQYNRRRQHIPEDDTESCFWVLLDMCQALFECDQLSSVSVKVINDVLQDTSGTLKQEFFMNKSFACPQFESAPLNMLIRDVRTLARRRRRLRLANCDAAALIKLFDKALARSDWPEADAHHRASTPKHDAYGVKECVQALTPEDLHCYWDPEYHRIIPVLEEPFTKITEEPVATAAVSMVEPLEPLDVDSPINPLQEKGTGSSGSSATRVESNVAQSPSMSEGKDRKRGRDEVEEVDIAAQTLVGSGIPVAKRRRVELPSLGRC